MELEIWHIVVIAVGGAVLLGILIGICYCCCKKKSVEKSTSQETLAKNRTLSPRNSQVILESGNDDFKPKFDDIEEGNITIPRPTGTVRGIPNQGFTQDDDSLPPPDYEINNGLTDIDIMLQDEYNELDDADYPPSK